MTPARDAATPAVIHVVDDDDAFRAAMSRLLRVAGFDVKEYRSAGDYLLVPARAEAMYAPEVFGRSEGSNFQVLDEGNVAAR